MFPAQSVIGWYTVGESPIAADSALHAQISELADASPSVFLLFNPDIPNDAKQLPFTVFESALTEGTDTEKTGKFVQLELGVEAGEAERIAVDDVANENASDSDPTGRELWTVHRQLIIFQKLLASVVKGTLSPCCMIVCASSSSMYQLLRPVSVETLTNIQQTDAKAPLP